MAVKLCHENEASELCMFLHSQAFGRQPKEGDLAEPFHSCIPDISVEPENVLQLSWFSSFSQDKGDKNTSHWESIFSCQTLTTHEKVCINPAISSDAILPLCQSSEKIYLMDRKYLHQAFWLLPILILDKNYHN
jgi:hypothetical protein